MFKTIIHGLVFILKEVLLMVLLVFIAITALAWILSLAGILLVATVWTTYGVAAGVAVAVFATIVNLGILYVIGLKVEAND